MWRLEIFVAIAVFPSKEFYRNWETKFPSIFAVAGKKRPRMTRIRNQESFFAGLGARITLASSAPAALREATLLLQ
jgi:hypothetical protein